MDAIEYLKEKARLTENCCINCSNCRLSSENNGEDIGCGELEQHYPEKAVEIMEQWSKDCPQKTRLQDFREKYPDAPLRIDGTPRVCCMALGYCKKCYIDIEDKKGCVECWNTPLEE